MWLQHFQTVRKQFCSSDIKRLARGFRFAMQNRGLEEASPDSHALHAQQGAQLLQLG